MWIHGLIKNENHAKFRESDTERRSIGADGEDAQQGQLLTEKKTT